MNAKSPAPPVQQGRPVDAAPAFSLRFWAALMASAVLAGLGGGLLMRLLYAVQALAWSEKGRDLYGAFVAASPERKLLCLAVAAVLVAAGASLLRFVKGGHAGELVAAIWFEDGRMPPLRTLGRAVLSVVVVALGAAVGREGALKQTGAVIGWQAAHRLGLTTQQRRVLTASAAGAGMAAAYNIPLAGAVFALEVLLGTVAWADAVAALSCSVVATCVSWVLLPMRMTYATPAYVLTPNLVFWAAAAGPVIGLFAVAYVRLIGWADLHKPKAELNRVAAPVIVLLLLAACSIRWPELLGNGKEVVQVAFDGGGRDPHMALALPMIALAVGRALATALCLRAGTPGGLFTPTLTCGALLAGGLGRLWAHLFSAESPGSYAVIGGAALLASASGGPVFAVIAVLELGQHIGGLVAPILLATAGACIVMRISGSPSIYTVRVKSDGRNAGGAGKKG